MKNISSFTKFLALPALALLLAGCAMFSGRETPSEYASDAAITSKIKADILAERTLKVLQINVETMQGVVQLSGFVDSKASEDKALSIANHIAGVKSVKDDLVVR